MIMEHWTTDVGGSNLFFSEDIIWMKRERLLTGQRFCCRIAGRDFNDCMTKYHKHMGWADFDPDSVETVYLD